MGYPKPLITIDNAPLIRHQVRAGYNTGASNVIVVVGYHESRVKAVLEKLPEQPGIVRNPERHGDQTSSMKSAIERMTSPRPVVMQLVDHPVIDPAVLQKIVPESLDGDVRIPTHNGRRGHPPLFSVSFLERIRAMESNTGINSLYADPDVRIEEVPVNHRSVVTDLDCPADLTEYRHDRQQGN